MNRKEQATRQRQADRRRRSLERKQAERAHRAWAATTPPRGAVR